MNRTILRAIGMAAGVLLTVAAIAAIQTIEYRIMEDARIKQVIRESVWGGCLKQEAFDRVPLRNS